MSVAPKCKFGEAMIALEDFRGCTILAAHHLNIADKTIYNRLNNQLVKKVDTGSGIVFKADRMKIQKYREGRGINAVRSKLGETMMAIEDMDGSIPLAAHHLGIERESIYDRLDNQCIKKITNGNDTYFKGDRKKAKKYRENKLNE
jgi:hypothetical protein